MDGLKGIEALAVSSQPQPRLGLAHVALCLLLFSLSPLLLLGASIVSLSRDDSDPNYRKLAAPRAGSMILGGSRAERDLNPTLIREGMFNFAFTIRISPFGEVYHRAIMAKLGGHRDGSFVISVSPPALSLFRGERLDDLREEHEALGRAHQYWGSPNIDYAARSLFDLSHRLRGDPRAWWGFWKATSHPTKGWMMVHTDGWVEIEPPKREALRREHIARRVDFMEELVDGAYPSPYRMQWLERTVKDLSRRGGHVLLVRLPISKPIRELEQGLWPDFDRDMAELAQRLNVRYVSLVDREPDEATSDGDHLQPAAADRVSREIRDLLVSIDGPHPAPA